VLPQLLLWPQSLAHEYGYFVSAFPALLLFIYVSLGFYSRLLRSGALALALSLFPFAFLGFWHPKYGFPAYFLDFTSCLFYLSGLLLLWEMLDGRKARWALPTVALTYSLATLARFNFAIFYGLALLPFFAVALYRRKDFRKNFGSLGRSELLYSLIFFLPGFLYFGFHLLKTLRFYKNYGYSIGQALDEVLAILSREAMDYFLGPQGNLHLVFLVLGIFLLLILWLIQSRKIDYLHLAAFASFSTLLGFLILTRSAKVPNVSFPAFFSICVGLAYLAAHACARFRIFQRPTRIPGLLLGLTSLSLVIAAGASLQLYKEPNSYEVRSRQTTDAIAQVLAREASTQASPITFNAFFDEYCWLPAVRAGFARAAKVLCAGQEYFSAHISAWKSDYGELEAEEIADKIYSKTQQHLEIIAIFSKASDAFDVPYLANEMSRQVAALMSTKVQADKEGWRLLESLPDTLYGSVSIYQNKRIGLGTQYRAFLLREARVNPRF
jgi:hypothetical protein